MNLEISKIDDLSGSNKSDEKDDSCSGDAQCSSSSISLSKNMSESQWICSLHKRWRNSNLKMCQNNRYFISLTIAENDLSISSIDRIVGYILSSLTNSLMARSLKDPASLGQDEVQTLVSSKF